MSLNVLKTGGSSMKNIQTALDSVAHNIANINTNGYKRTRVNFESVVGSSRFSGAAVNSVISDTSQGRLKATGIWSDLAIQGEGYFALQDTDGSIVYSRSGHFKVDSLNQLIDPDGNYVLSAGGGRIVLPNNISDIEVSQAGEINVLLAGQDGFQLVDQLQLATFTNPQSLEAVGNNLLRVGLNSGPASFSRALETGTGTAETVIVSGAVEQSNANLATEFVDLTAYQRSFQAVSRAVSTADELLESTISLAR